MASDQATPKAQQSRKSRVIALSVGGALAKFIGIATTAIMTRLLTKDDVAAYRQVFLAFMTVGPLMTMGVGQGMYYFLPGEEKRVRGRVSDALLLLGAIGMAFSLFLLLGGNDLLAQRFSNPKVARLLIWMVPYALLTTPASISSSVLVARDEVNLSSAFGVIKQLIIGIATVIPLLLWQSCESAIAGNVVSSALMAVASYALMIRVLPRDDMRPSLTGIKDLLIFGVPLAMATMADTLSRQLDKLIVGFMSPAQVFAEFSVGAIEIPLIGMITGSVTAIMLTDMRKAVADGEHREALRLFHLTSQKTSLLLFPIMFFFLIAADDFVALMFTKDYAGAAAPFRWYLGVLPIRTAFFGALCMAFGMSSFLLFRSVTTLACNALLSVLCVWQLGPTGAVISTVATKYIWAVPISFYVLAKALDCRWTEIPPFRYLLVTLMQLLPVSAVALFVSMQISDPLIGFVTTAAIFGLFLAYWWNGRLYTVAELRKRLFPSTSKN